MIEIVDFINCELSSSNTRKVCAVCVGVSTLYQNGAFDSFASVRHREICAFSFV